MPGTGSLDHLIELRRDLHEHPEPAWREFYTTARIIEELERIGVDDLHVGPEAIDEQYQWGKPADDADIDTWFERAITDGAHPEILDQLAGGYTGVVASIDQGEGPHVALRVDIDALFVEESDDPSHAPAAGGYRSMRDGLMHACGHDAHATIGIGVLERIQTSDFTGRFTVIFQPAEEEIGGGKAVAEGGLIDDVDYLYAVHIGLDHPTGEVVAGIDGFLAVTNVFAEFTGASAHAGARPELGANAVQALSSAVNNLYAIARHNDGITRINVGRVEGGSASNVIPETATLQGEVRGGTTALRDYMKERSRTVIESAAAMHDCTVDIEYGPEAPSATSDEDLVSIVESVAQEVNGVDSILHRDRLGGSEDATYLMEHVQDRDGLACYVGIGTDHPGGHHTGTFDVDEESIRIGIDVLAGAIERTG